MVAVCIIMFDTEISRIITFLFLVVGCYLFRAIYPMYLLLYIEKSDIIPIER